MNLVITRTALPGGQPRVEAFGDVLDVRCDPIDADNRTQAERNADNAIKAARLARVETQLRSDLEELFRWSGQGVVRVKVDSVIEHLTRALEAPIEP